MKQLLLITTLFIGSIAAAQNYVALKANERQMEEAKEFTSKLDKALSLTEKQILSAEQVRGEFIARRDEIIGSKEMTVLEKNELLEAIYVEEGKEMANILVRNQLNRYKIIRGDLQPLIVIKE